MKTLFAVLFASTAVVLAGAARAEQHKCHDITSNIDRLACYDEATGKTAAKVETTATEPLADKGKWRVQTEKSKFEDTKDVYLTLVSNDYMPNRFGQTSQAKLNLRCQENTTAFTIWFGGYHMADLQSYGHVDYRLDKGKASVWPMSESTSNQHLGLWSGSSSIPQIKKMLGKEELVIRATPFGENPVELTFDVSGLDEAIKPLREECGW